MLVAANVRTLSRLGVNFFDVRVIINRLLVFVAGGPEKGQRVAAATYLKNFLRSHWSEENAMSPEERLEFRNQLMEVLLRVDGIVLKLLAEAVR